MSHSNKDGVSSAENKEGRLRIKENTFPFDTYPTPSGTACVLRVGDCADKRHAWPLFIGDKSARANEFSCGSLRGAISDGCPNRDLVDSFHPSGPEEMFSKERL